MLIGAAGPPLPYTDPWLSGYDDRLRDLSFRGRRIAYFHEIPHPHTFRYRVFNMVRALEAQPELDISAAWFVRDDFDHGLEFVERADALVICRTRYDAQVGRMIARARARNIPVLYDVDDLIFNPDYAHLIGDSIGRDLSSSALWDWWFGEIARLGATLRQCDGAITTNAFLAHHITDYAPWIVPKLARNFMNEMQTTVSQAIYERKRSSRFARDEHVHIGYFSGTRSHNKDFRQAAGALARLMAEDSRVVLRIVGLLDLPSDFQQYQDRIEMLPITDFLNLQRLQGEIEICLAPVQDTVFTQCKSELKYFEAAATGAVTIASPTFAFRQAIRDGENAFLARSHEWHDCLGNIIAMLDDNPRQYSALAARAMTDATQTYAWNRQAAAIEAAVFGSHGAPVGSESRRPWK